MMNLTEEELFELEMLGSLTKQLYEISHGIFLVAHDTRVYEFIDNLDTILYQRYYDLCYDYAKNKLVQTDGSDDENV